MPTVTPARALRELWEAGGAGNATCAKAGRGGSSDSRGRGDGIVAMPATSDASDVGKAAVTLDAASYGTEARRTAVSKHREAADVGPHS